MAVSKYLQKSAPKRAWGKFKVESGEWKKMQFSSHLTMDYGQDSSREFMRQFVSDVIVTEGG